MNSELVKITLNQIEEVISLIRNTFDFFVASDYSAEGVMGFYSYIEIKECLRRLDDKRYDLCGYIENGTIIGVIEVRNRSHISLLFVNKDYHKRGIAKKLVTFMFKEWQGDITVNSSPYARAIYEKLGFEKISKEYVKDGITYIPMIRYYD